jgi:hypothetical protein
MKVAKIMLLVAATGLLAGHQIAWAQPKIAPPKGGIFGNQPQINPGIAKKLKPFKPNKPNPQPSGPSGNPKPGKPQPPWWAPLANPNTWLGLAHPNHHPGWHPGPHHPHHPGPHYPNYPEPMPVVPDWHDPDVPAPAPENSLHDPIELFNPDRNGAPIRCLVDGRLVELEPGESKMIPGADRRIIRFHRGGDFGEARYGMETGLYWFARSDQGWELYHGPYRQIGEAPATSDLPANPW